MFTRARSMRTILAGVLAAVGLTAGVAAPAAAADPGEFSRMDITANVHRNGEIEVSVDFDFDFASVPGHGPLLTLVTRQEMDEDPNHYRELRVTDVHATSETGAPSRVSLDAEDGGLGIYVGDGNTFVNGIQQYTVTYTVSGGVNPSVEGNDELYWNVIGSGFDLPVRDASITVNGPAEVEWAACYAGPVGSGTACDAYRTTGPTVEYTQEEASNGTTVAIGYPEGTFVGAEQNLVPRRTWSTVWGVAGPAGIAAAVIAIVGIGAVAVVASRRGRDREYLGLTPGLYPSASTATGTVQAAAAAPRTRFRRRGPIAVRFDPPPDMPPGVLGTLADEHADDRDVSATIVDLAVRGFYVMTTSKSEEGETRWTLSRPKSRPYDEWIADPSLCGYERDLLRGLFPGGQRKARLDRLPNKFSTTYFAVQDSLYDEVMDRGWFYASPEKVRSTWRMRGWLGLLVGLVAAWLLHYAWMSIIGAAVVLVSIVVLVAAKHMPARTPEGSTALALVLGFREYLVTAEASQIRFEAGQDIFSRYLPYAMAFGVEERWAKLFADLARQGVSVPEPDWYRGERGTVLYSRVSTRSLSSSLRSGMTRTSLSSSGGSSSTGGSSGRSGRSGSSGGGVGGGGGGRW